MYREKNSPHTCQFFMFVAFTTLLASLGCSQRDVTENVEVVVDGARDVRLAVTLHMDGIAAQIEQRAAKEHTPEPRAAVWLDWRKRVGLNVAKLYLVKEDAHDAEAIIVIPDAEQTIWNELSTSNLFESYLEKDANGALRPALESLPTDVATELPESVRQLQVKWHAGQVVVASPERLQQLEAGTWSANSALSSQLTARIDSPESLFTLAAVVPEEFNFNLEEQLKTSAAAKQLPDGARMMLFLFNAYFDGLRDLLSTTDALAVSVSLPSENQRQVRYAQLFDNAKIAATTHGRLTTPVTENDDDGGLAFSAATLLQDEQVQQQVRRFGRLIEVDASWPADADGKVSSLAQSAVASLSFGRDTGTSSPPTEGPIKTQYTMTPHFVTLTPRQLRTTVQRQLQSQLFPGWANDHGDEPSMQVELDTFTLPNGVLSEGSYEVLDVMTTERHNVLRPDERAAQFRTLQLAYPGSQHLSIPFQTGTDKKLLRTAQIQFTLEVPARVDVVEFAANEAAGTKKKAGKRTVALKRIERDVADVTYRGNATPRLFAFDKSGRALSSREWGSGGGSSYGRFAGVIDKLWVAFPGKAEKLVVAVDANLHGGEALRLPEKPSASVPVRYDATLQETYQSLRESELDNLAVDLRQAVEFGREQLCIDLPRASQGAKVAWELYWFGKDRPISLPGYSFTQNAQLVWAPQDGLGDATAVTGMAMITLPTEFATLVFKKKKNGAWNTATANAHTVRCQFNHNQITYAPDDLNVMALHVFDAHDRRLRIDHSRQIRGESTTIPVWGQPQRVEIVVSGKTIEKALAVDIAHDGTDKVAFERFKNRVPKYHQALSALMRIQQGVQRGPYAYDEIAGLYYLHDKKEQPLQLIPRELAHACPQEADRFGYDVQPYGDYHFMRLPLAGQPSVQSDRKRKFRWAKGEFEVAARSQRAVVAMPVKETDPTFIVHWGSAYMKFLGGQRLEEVPQHLSQDGWAQIEPARSPR